MPTDALPRAQHPDVDLERIPLDRLGDQISDLAGSIAAATCRWLLMIAAFDRREGAQAWGFPHTTAWLHWRCGLDLRAAREHVRVARSLVERPRVIEAFARGELSFSKVRAITRVVTDDNEQTLVMWARHATAAQMERIARTYRRVAGGSILGEHQRRVRDRSVTWRGDEDGSVVLTARLPVDAAAIVIKAIESALEQLDADRAGSAEQPGPGTGSAEPLEPRAARAADALVAVAEASLEHPASRSVRHEVLVQIDAAGLVEDPDVGGTAEVDDLGTVPAEVARRIGCDAALRAVVRGGDGQVLAIGRRTRSISPALRRALEVRDRTCRYPGCDATARLQAHHVKHWADGGETSLANTGLHCPVHHRVVHEGGITCTAGPGGTLIYRRADGTLIPEVPKPAPPRALHAVEPGAVVGQAGDPLHLDLAIDALAWLDDLGGMRTDLAQWRFRGTAPPREGAAR